jgi:hypothetical protein
MSQTVLAALSLFRGSLAVTIGLDELMKLAPSLPSKNDILLAAASTAVSIMLFVVFDLMAGHLIAGPPTPVDSPYLKRSSGWYELKPNYSGVERFGPVSFNTFTDALGFRSAAAKPSANAQSEVIFLGDSFTYGVNGPWEHSFVGIYAAASGHSVINAGVSSYSPTAYVHQYKKALSANLLKSPHIVVVGIDVGDVQDEAAIWMDGRDHPVKMRNEQNESPGDLRGYIIKSLPLTVGIYSYLRAQPPPPIPDHICHFARSAFTYADWGELDRPTGRDGYGPLGVRKGLEKVELKLREIVGIAASNGAVAYFLIYPWPAQICHEDRFSWSMHVREMCSRLGCAGVIDAIPVFRSLAAGLGDKWYKGYFLYGDVHFNEAGNKVVAEELLGALASAR